MSPTEASGVHLLLEVDFTHVKGFTRHVGTMWGLPRTACLGKEVGSFQGGQHRSSREAAQKALKVSDDVRGAQQVEVQ